MSGRHLRRRRLRLGGIAVVAAVALAIAGATWAIGTRGDDGSPTATTIDGPSAAASAAASPFRTPSPIPGFLMVADAGNHRMLLIDSRKRVLWRYPTPGRPPSFPLGYDDDVFFGPDHRVLITNQEHQHTIEMVSFPEGNVVWHYGHVAAPGSSAGYLNTPDDAYLLPNGLRSVADIKNCRVIFLTASGGIARQLGKTGVCAHDPPRTFASPNGDTPLPDGGTLVTEIGGSWIDDISANGRLRWSVHAPIGYPSDAQLLPDGTILVADYSSPGHVLIMNRHGHVLWEYGPATGAAALDHPSLAIQLPNGLIAVNDDYRHRVVLISRQGHRIVWQYGHTDVAGTRDGYLDIPDGMDFLPFDVAMNDPAIRPVVSKG
jgi:hypothetical protein